MSNRPLLLAGFLGASVAVPYVMHHPTVQQLLGPSGGSAMTVDEALSADLEPQIPLVAKPAPVPRATTATPEILEGPTVANFAEIFRFDATASWVSGRWGRVSTAPGDYGLKGYRVALVTGTGHDDLAGALTYYFDNQHRAKRITFRGVTGDPARLVAYLVQVHGLEREIEEHAGRTLFAKKEWGKRTSTLEIKVAPLLVGSRPHERYELMLTLDRPAGDDDGPSAQADANNKGYSFRPW